MSAEVIGPGRVAVVTGAASGIGRALAGAFGAAGCTVVLADIEAGPLEAVADELNAAGVTVAAVPTDVADAAAVERLAATTVERFGRVDVLCNNAGVSTFNLLADQTLDDWRWVFDVNVWGVVHGIHSFLPIMRAQDGPAHIVSTASVGGLLGGPAFIGPYAATKAAVISISETLHKEVQLLGTPIGVSVLCPGATETAVLESERVRPATLGHEQRGEMAEGMRLAVKQLCSGPTGKSPAEVADQVLDAIRADEFWIITHPWERPIVVERVDGMLAKFPPPPAA
jgi:NAD(P)-dependent dehydrogenase (short-subunit alcohol dehydrogenase family)